MECFEEKLKLTSLKMLAHKEMENPNFFFAQKCSNDCVLLSSRPLYL